MKKGTISESDSILYYFLVDMNKTIKTIKSRIALVGWPFLAKHNGTFVLLWLRGQIIWTIEEILTG